MRYELSDPKSRKKAQEYFNKLMNAEYNIELKKIYPPRTIKQNSLFHVYCAIFGNEFGYSPDEAKTLIKRELGYVYEKNGQKFLEHTSEMPKDKMARLIDRFRSFAMGLGCYLPTEDEVKNNYIEVMNQVDYAKTHPHIS